MNGVSAAISNTPGILSESRKSDTHGINSAFCVDSGRLNFAMASFCGAISTPIRSVSPIMQLPSRKT